MPMTSKDLLYTREEGYSEFALWPISREMNCNVGPFSFLLKMAKKCESFPRKLYSNRFLV